MNWFDVFKEKPRRIGFYPFLMCVEGTQHSTKMRWDGDKWIGAHGHALTLMPGDRWAGLTKECHDSIAAEIGGLK